MSTVESQPFSALHIEVPCERNTGSSRFCGSLLPVELTAAGLNLRVFHLSSGQTDDQSLVRNVDILPLRFC